MADEAPATDAPPAEEVPAAEEAPAAEPAAPPKPSGPAYWKFPPKPKEKAKDILDIDEVKNSLYALSASFLIFFLTSRTQSLAETNLKVSSAWKFLSIYILSILILIFNLQFSEMPSESSTVKERAPFNSRWWKKF